MTTQPSSFTGRKRQRKTRPGVKGADIVSKLVITLGGLGTIVAVMMVCLFLVWVVVPSFSAPEIKDGTRLPAPYSSGVPVQVGTDEYHVLSYALMPDGRVVVYRLDQGGKVLAELKPLGDATLTAAAFAPDGREVALGFADGSVRTGTIGFSTEFLPPDKLNDALRAMKPGEQLEFDGGIVQLTSEGQHRVQRLAVNLLDPVSSGSDKPVVLMDLAHSGTGIVFCALNADGNLRINSISERTNMLTHKVTRTVRTSDLPFKLDHRGLPAFVGLSGVGDAAFVVWADGHCVRYDTRDLRNPKVAESLNLLKAPEARITSIRFMLGRSTLIVGDSLGRLRGWFCIKPDDAVTIDGRILVQAHEVDLGDSPVSAIASSARTRMVAAGTEAGDVHLIQVTSDEVLNSVRIDPPARIDRVVISAKDDAVLAATGTHIMSWHVDPKHPEMSMRALFRPIWYEGYVHPTHTWQSSSGDDAFEPKLGLMPLIFGTIKATFYSLIFAVPLALLAAVYTSEFLHPRIKARVKPTVELMASLPSVVLGFLAGLVLASYVEALLPALIASAFTLPLMFLMGAYLWQMLPRHTQLYLHHLGTVDADARQSAKFRLMNQIVFTFGGVRLMLLLLMLLLGVLLALAMGPMVVRVLFANDLRSWLDGQVGSGAAGWFIALLPLSGLLSAVLVSRLVNPRIRSGNGWSHRKCATVDMLKFVAGLLGAVAIAGVSAWLINAVGLDPRGPINIGSFNIAPAGTYVQRNALIVGFVMGFAVIPIIYTIAEDALSAVPDHLRSASLGAGATQWQTATRIIIPTAMSGLFSAIMIGLGRAVGETMIVLMAAGNTPVMQMNMFNGFRTLSANIAVELPEAVRDSTHYRTLFLAALTLFIMTFFVNTAAEIVRLRFRKRAVQL